MLVSMQNASFGFNGEPLLENITFRLSEEDRVGLVGGNGEGKTTLLRLILSELEIESGEVFRKNGLQIGYLAQTGGYDSSATVFEEMRLIFQKELEAISSLREIEQQLSLLSETDPKYAMLSSKYEALNKFVSAKDGYLVDVKIRTVLNGMGFEEVYEQPISTLSGGEKTRLKLARLLLEQPDLLILDEPTNHLDIKTLFWLEEYLSTYKGALLIVSHDRYFLDRTVTEIYELENKKLSCFKGNYSKYKILKAEKTAFLLKEYEKQQEEIAHLQDYVDRNLVRASTAKSAQSRVKKLEKIERVEKPSLPPTPPRFSFTYSTRPYERVIEVSALRLQAGDKVLLENASFSLMRGEKCAIIGDNGTGKSTLLKEIVSEKNPKIQLGRFVKIAYYDQENANLDPQNTVLGELWGRHVLWDQTKVRGVLASVLLKEEDIDKKVFMLSGGERAKLALAVFETENGNVLLLDEPTNHLDLQARESLEDALRAFDGTILFVSHDRYFIEAIAGKIIELENGRLQIFEGSYGEYCQKKKIDEPTAPAKKTATTNSGYRSKEDRAKETKKRVRVSEIEKEISRLEEENNKLLEEISTPGVASNFPLLEEKCKKMDEIKRKIDSLYEEYESYL